MIFFRTLTARKTVAIFALLAALSSSSLAYSQPNYQQQYGSPNLFADMFMDSLYGGAIGALVGGSLCILTQQPGKHLDRIGYGAAIGVLGGTAFAVANAARHSAFVEMDNNKVRFAMPTIQPSVEKDNHHPAVVSANADLLALRF
jgi:peptidoglycan/LPS O-acetylase OafA/YrhL